MTTQDTKQAEEFFQSDAGLLPLFYMLAKKLFSQFPNASIKVQKSQIAFQDGKSFCCVWLPIRRSIKGRPEHYFVLSFGLRTRLENKRIAEATEPYPNRWTHHVIVSGPSDIDEELFTWIGLAHALKEKR